MENFTANARFLLLREHNEVTRYNLIVFVNITYRGKTKSCRALNGDVARGSLLERDALIRALPKQRHTYVRPMIFCEPAPFRRLQKRGYSRAKRRAIIRI